MKRFLLALIPALLIFAGTQAFAQNSQTTLTTKNDAKLGTILADAKGMTVYMFLKDTKENESTCTDKCAAIWPPVTATGAVTLPSGVDGKIATFKRADGAMQVSYNGIPLYYFSKDKDKGDAYGQGMGGVWFVVKPGAKFGEAPSASPVASPVASPMASPAASSSAVQIKNFAFAPASLTVSVGTTVTWTNNDSVTHTVTANDKSFDSGNLVPGKTFSFTFKKAGTYAYHCAIHTNMTATIVVK